MASIPQDAHAVAAAAASAGQDHDRLPHHHASPAVPAAHPATPADVTEISASQKMLSATLGSLITGLLGA